MNITAKVISDALHAKHPEPQWASFSELRDATGFGQSRTIDFATFNTWKSGHGPRIAYEIKVTRRDFQRELDQPQKHAWVTEIFHETYFAAPAGLLQPSEIPEGWGLLEVRETKSGQIATKRAVRAKLRKPRDPSYLTVCSMLRRAAVQIARARSRTFEFEGDVVTPQQLEEIVKKRVADETSWEKHQIETERTALQREREQAQKDTLPMRDLRRAAGHHGMNASRESVEQLIEIAVQRRLNILHRELKQAHESLTRILTETGK